MRVDTTVSENSILNMIISAIDFRDTIGYWAALDSWKLPLEFDPNDLEWLSSPWDKETWKGYFGPLVPGGELVLKDLETGDLYPLTLESVQKGLACMAEKAPRHYGDLLSENDDAITADVFIQCCCFGEIVYG